MSEARYLVGDVFERMATIPDGSIDLIVTSPPFLALRSYLPADHPDKGKEIGSEATPADFLTTLLALTVEWRRVLAPHGSLCVELGDTYAGSGGGGGDYLEGGLREGQPGFGGSASRQREGNAAHWRQKNQDRAGWPLDKSLCLLPTLYPASLAYGRNLLKTGLTPEEMLHHIDLWIGSGIPAADAIRMAHDWLPQRRQYWDEAATIEPWRIRNQIVWHRPNPPVGALGDKVRPSTSYITVACTSRTRWFDLDSERTPHARDYTNEKPGGLTEFNRTGHNGLGDHQRSTVADPAGAPPLDCWHDTTTDDVWTIPTQPYKGSHYATFPITLPRKLINLMCPRQVCRWCGEPRRRLTENPNEGHGANMWNRHGTAAAVFHKDIDRPHNSERTTLGWSDCGHNAWRRGLVLDPFCGSGTTLVAASELGRDSIGIDIDARNLDLARQRIGMFLIEEEVAS